MSDGRKEGAPSRIKVTDKRRFASDGTARDDLPAEDQRDAPTESRTTAAPKKKAVPAPPKADPLPGDGRPEIDFISFVASLATNALAALGALPEAIEQGLPVNPELAREYIGILAMLQEKTRGNLTAPEERAMQQILTDLRLRFVESSKKSGPS